MIGRKRSALLCLGNRVVPRLILPRGQFPAGAAEPVRPLLLLLLFLLLVLLDKLAAHLVAALQISTVHRGLPQYHDDNAPSRHQVPKVGRHQHVSQGKAGPTEDINVDILRSLKAAACAIVPIRSGA